MAAVSVFVDDAIRGDLPMVCVRTGAPADVKVRVHKPVGGGIPFWAWFLLFLGPLGIVALVLAAVLAPGTEYLTVRLPETEASFARERHLERWRRGRLAAMGAGVVLGVVGAFRPGVYSRLWLATGACLLAAGAVSVMLRRRSVGLSIDVTRRWVTFTNVHPAFVDAVDKRTTSHD